MSSNEKMARAALNQEPIYEHGVRYWRDLYWRENDHPGHHFDR